MSKDTVHDKLGLALAGGGFRASIFHIGVFRRLAHLDLLRFVEVISSVSGGSIVAALYALLLKREMEKPDFNGRLSQQQYLTIVDDLETRLCLGIQKNLRTWLFMNPFNIFYGVMSGDHLSRAMARLYEKNLYRQTIEELQAHYPGQMSLRDIKIKPGGKTIQQLGFDDIESYNRYQVLHDGSAITKLILNATSLNSGSRFWFSGSEIGEWDAGYLHQKDSQLIINTLKPLLERARHAVATTTQNLASIASDPTGEVIVWCVCKGDRQQRPAHWKTLFDSWLSYFVNGDTRSDSLDALLSCKFGSLRFARQVTRSLATSLEKEVDSIDGRTRAQHLFVLAARLGFICHQYAEEVRSWLLLLEKDQLLKLCALVNEVYLVRSADVLSDTADNDLKNFPLSHAVAASANFPPVFAPFQLTNLYDNLHVSRLGLTDGGVYDNLGVIGLIDEDCNFIISSDTGLTSKPQRRVSTGRIGMMMRIVSVLTDDGARQTREVLLERHRVASGLALAPCKVSPAVAEEVTQSLDSILQPRELFGLAAFKIDSPEICEREAAIAQRPYSAKDVAQIRTDLDAFGDIEMDALIDQGYINCGLFLKRWFALDSERHVPEHLMCHYGSHAKERYPYRAASQSDGKPPVTRPCVKTPSDQLKQQTIRAAKSRWPKVFLIGRSPWCWFAWSTVLLMLLAAWWGLADRQINLLESVQTLLTKVLFLEQLGLVGNVSWHQLIMTIVIVGVAYMLLKYATGKWFDLVDNLQEKGYRGLARRMSAAARIPRLVRAFTTLIVIKLVVLVFVWLAYLYSRLYLWATNRGPRGQSCRNTKPRR